MREWYCTSDRHLRVRHMSMSVIVMLTVAMFTGCNASDSSAWDWKRMRSQRKLTAYNDALGMNSLRPPPAGTVSRESRDDSAPTPAVDLSRGRARYETFCSVCHGSKGEGETLVGLNMEGPKPPSLLRDTLSFGDAKVFAAITNGVGRMPAFAGEISAHDRWQIVAYVASLGRQVPSAGRQ